MWGEEKDITLYLIATSPDGFIKGLVKFMNNGSTDSHNSSMDSLGSEVSLDAGNTYAFVDSL